MAKRAVGGRCSGYYERLVEDGGDVGDGLDGGNLVVVDGELEEGVFKVEWVVERRKKVRRI